jgi:hypothetical protein
VMYCVVWKEKIKARITRRHNELKPYLDIDLWN